MSTAAVLIAFLLFAPPDPQAEGLKALEEQRYPDAVAIFQKAVASDPKDYGAQFHLALAQSMLKRDPEAIAGYRKVLELKPGLYEAELNLGMVLLRNQQAPEAAKLLASAAGKKPKEYRPALYAGDAFLAAGDAEKASSYFEKAAALDEKSAEAQDGWGRALARLARWEDAQTHLRRAASLDPGFQNSLLELAEQEERAGKSREAAALYAEFPQNAGAQERRGQILLEAGDAEGAIQSLEAAVKLSPTDANRFALATAYLAAKQTEKALPLLEQTVASGNPGYETRMVYARALRDQKQYQKAAQAFYQATQTKPDGLEAWNDLAGMLILLNADQRALAALDKVKALGGEKPAHFYFRAMLFDRNKMQKEALDSYEKFLAGSQGQHPDEEFKARQRVRILQKELAK